MLIIDSKENRPVLGSVSEDFQLFLLKISKQESFMLLSDFVYGDPIAGNIRPISLEIKLITFIYCWSLDLICLSILLNSPIQE